ncbi:hypothetical protein [Novosphingobium sp.]|uniref:hypothetical protein n=1 Tax=Novosphingobium sp. TaxID=1874826 RepID=UPI002FDDD383
MADYALTANRREFLSSTAGVVLATVIPSPAPATDYRLAWDAALRRVQLADFEWRTKSDAIDAMDRSSAAWAQANDELEALVETFSDAEIALLDTPAPDRIALQWKLDRILDGGINGPWTESYSADYIRQTVADYRRLLGDA